MVSTDVPSISPPLMMAAAPNVMRHSPRRSRSPLIGPCRGGKVRAIKVSAVLCRLSRCFFSGGFEKNRFFFLGIFRERTVLWWVRGNGKIVMFSDGLMNRCDVAPLGRDHRALLCGYLCISGL